MTDTNKGEPMKTLPEILGDSSSEWCGCYEGDMDDRFPEMKAEATEAIAKELMGCLPEKLEFKPKKNMSCSFELANDYPNPCKYCGGTRKYEWREFTKKHGISPDQIDGANHTLDEVRARLTAFIGKGEK